MKHSSRRWLVGPLLAAVAVGGGYAVRSLSAREGAPGGEQARQPASGLRKSGDLVRLTRNVPGEGKPIVIDADEVFTWDEEGLCVVLLRGQVLVQQATVQARFAEGVAWLDLGAYRSTGVLHLRLYAEGRARFLHGTDAQEAPRGILELSTRGEFRLRAKDNKVVRQPQPDAPLVRRARAAGVGPAPRPPADRAAALRDALGGGWRTAHGGVKPASFEEKAPGPNNPPVRTPGGPDARPVNLPGPTDPAAQPASPGAQPPPPDPSKGLPAPPPPDPPPSAPGPNVLPAPPPAPAAPPAEPPPGLPPPARPSGPPRPSPPPGPPPPGPARQYTVMPRTGRRFDVNIQRAPNGEQVIVVTGGVILAVRNVPNIGFLDLEADRLVIWTKGQDAQQLITNLQSPEGQTSNDLEFYLAGHVEIREQVQTGFREQKTLSADEVYYDVNRNVAVALNARMEITSDVMAARLRSPAAANQPVILTAEQLYRLNATTFELVRAQVFSSRLPSDPGLTVLTAQATVEDRTTTPRSLFGGPLIDRRTGRPLEQKQTIISARDVTLEIEDVPFFYLPRVTADARDPLGPFQSFNFGYNRIFGFQLGTSLDVYQLLGVQPYEGTRWRLNLDYLTKRGPGAGTTFDYAGRLPELNPGDGTFFDLGTRYEGLVQAYGMYDNNYDVLGGPRPNNNFSPPDFRGRFLWRQGVYDLPCGFNVQAQVSALSDRNFLEQYYKREFDMDPNQDTFVYVKQQQDNWAWYALAEPRVRNWVTETEWLPRVDGYLIGQSILDRLTYDVHASAAYAQLRLTSDPPGGLMGGLPPPPGFPPYVSPTDVADRTGRFYVMQELAAPFALGPLKLVPYGQLLLAEYTRDLEGQERGRVWGGGGVRGSIPLTRLYPDIQSELFNVNGINHKVVISGNYFRAEASDPHTLFPQLDRLNDEATDQSLRDYREFAPLFNGRRGYFVSTETGSTLMPTLFDPQVYALRRLVLDRIDTLDTIEVLQLDVRQRWQTKRGFPGAQHIVDWMVLDTSLSYFPNPSRDNFGKPFAFLEYRWLWNIGDRTALESTGWIDPLGTVLQPGPPAVTGTGPRVFTIGAYFNRPDRTNFYLGYREIEPIQSRAVTAAVTYIFSPKYAMTFTTSYDFGSQQALNNSVVFTRIGTDLQVSLGFSYNALQNNFGALVEVVPNLVAGRQSGALAALGGPGGLFR